MKIILFLSQRFTPVATSNSMSNIYKSTNPFYQSQATNSFSDLIQSNNREDSPEECMICSDNKREVLFKPCNHINACKACSVRCKKCLICKEQIQDRVEIEDCMVCDEKKSSILFQPCGHFCTCENCSKLMKKCIKCKIQIEPQLSFLPGCNNDELKNNSLLNASLNAGDELMDKNGVKKLQQQLQDIKEQTLCPVCLDKLKNMIFLCGHGTCQNCGDQMKECPICRKEIQKKILIY